MSETSDLFNAVCIAYKYRLIFPTAKEYTEAWGDSFETINANRTNTPRLYYYYHVLDALYKNCTWDLKTVADSYRRASLSYHTIDWGRRKQMASRRRFCRLMFRIYASGMNTLSGGEYRKFNQVDLVERMEDKSILNALFPIDASPALQLEHLFIILFSFEVISPIESVYLDAGDFSGKRSRDLSEEKLRLGRENFRHMLRLLREDFPRIGRFEKPGGFMDIEILMDLLQNDDASLLLYTPLFYLVLLEVLVSCCQATYDPQKREELCTDTDSLNLPGIWIDGEDNGKNRFWIFSDPWVCRYSVKDNKWELHLYLLLCPKNADTRQMFFGALAPLGTILTPLCSDKETFSASQTEMICIEMEADGQDQIHIVRLYQLIPTPHPHIWKEFRRLEKSDERYIKFKKILSDIYPQDGTAKSYPISPLMDKFKNCMVASDSEYYYVHDSPASLRHTLKEQPEDYFHLVENVGTPTESLLNIEVSPRHPLYLIPRHLDKKPAGPSSLSAFSDVVHNIPDIDHISIFHIETEDGTAKEVSGRQKEKNTGNQSRKIRKTYLSIPDSFCTIELNDKTIRELGIRKLTSFQVTGL